VLSWVSFFSDAASEMLYPVFPTFVTVTLGAPVAALGLIEGVAEGTASVGKAISGRLADRSQRRQMIALGYAISAGAKPLIGLASASSESPSASRRSVGPSPTPRGTSYRAATGRS